MIQIKNSKNIIKYYKNYKVVIALIFIFLFCFLLKNNGNIFLNYRKKISQLELIFIVVLGIIISYLDKYIASLLFILIIIHYKFAIKEFFIETDELNKIIKNEIKKNETINNNINVVYLEEENLLQNNNSVQDSEKNTIVEEIFNKYYNDNNILNKLKSTYDTNILGKIKSNIIIDYDMSTKDKYSNSSLIGIDYKKNTDNKSFDDLINEKNDNKK